MKKYYFCLKEMCIRDSNKTEAMDYFVSGLADIGKQSSLIVKSSANKNSKFDRTFLDNNGNTLSNSSSTISKLKSGINTPQQKVYNVISFIKEHPKMFSENKVGMSPDRLVNLVCNRLLNQPIEAVSYTHLPQRQEIGHSDKGSISMCPREIQQHDRQQFLCKTEEAGTD